MNKKNTITVYWSPWSLPEWNNLVSMLWQEPVRVMQSLPKPAVDPYRSCKAANSLFDNTFVLTHPQSIHAKFSDLENPTNETSDSRFQVREPSEVGAHTVTLETCSWIFFAEEDVEVSTSPPFMHKTLTQDYGYMTVGKFNIARWFRPLNMIHQLWAGVTEVKVLEGEPAIYISFNTDKKVILKRFNLTPDLYSMGVECSELKRSLPRMHLDMLYDLFTKSMRHKKTLKLIKNNLLE